MKIPFKSYLNGLFLAFLFLLFTSGTSDRAPEGCKFRGVNFNLAKVKIVPAYQNHTFKVRIVERDEALTVRFYSNSYHSNRCGQWRLVDSETPDFTVTFVDYGEDFTIRIADGD